MPLRIDAPVRQTRLRLEPGGEKVRRGERIGAGLLEPLALGDEVTAAAQPPLVYLQRRGALRRGG